MQEEKIELQLQEINKQLQILGKNISFIVQIILQGNSEGVAQEEGKFELGIEDITQENSLEEAIEQENVRLISYVG